MASETTTGDRISDAAGTTRDESSQIASTARDEARNVTETAREQARSAASRMQDELRQRAGEEASKLAQTLRDTSRQLATMAGSSGDEQSFAAGLVREVSNATGRVASRLDEGGFDSMLADVRSWARRNPGGFLLGAAVAGFAMGRLVRHLTGNGNGGGSGDMRLSDYSPGTSSMYPPALGEPAIGGDPYEEFRSAGTTGPTTTGVLE